MNSSSFDNWWDKNEKEYSADACHMSEYQMASVVWKAAIAEAASLVEREEGSPYLTDKVRALA